MESFTTPLNISLARMRDLSLDEVPGSISFLNNRSLRLISRPPCMTDCLPHLLEVLLVVLGHGLKNIQNQ
nr:hypothetical protein Itr_chr11CG15830 [Ipomoea trifida]